LVVLAVAEQPLVEVDAGEAEQTRPRRQVAKKQIGPRHRSLPHQNRFPA
jgi:hypothetical protein